MREQFINSKTIGVVYKNLVSKLNLELNKEEKTKLTKKIIKVMEDVFSKIDPNRVNENNIPNFLKNFDKTDKTTLGQFISNNKPKIKIDEAKLRDIKLSKILR